MAGGTWTTENKVRPGAYFNFRPAADSQSTIADRGVATMPVVMSWGPEGTVMEIYSTDLANGSAKPLLGYGAGESGSLIFRECLQHCYKLLAYRVNGGTKAAASAGGITATAKYSGLRGNDLQLAVEALESGFAVITYLDGSEVDRQDIAAPGDLTDNNWATFAIGGTLTAAAAVPFSGGSDGPAQAGAYASYFDALRMENWQVMGIPSADVSLPPLLKSYIYDLRENEGKKVQGVTYDYAADYEGIISSKQGYSREKETVSPTDFIAWVTGATAGAAVNESLTYRLIDDAVAITGQMTDSEINARLRQGFLVLSRRIDGKIIVEQDINTLVSYSDTKVKAFSKNRVVRVLDEIGNQIALIFSLYYVGKVGNDAGGRDLFKGDIITYCRELTALRAIQNFDAKEDVSIAAGNDGDSVVVTLAVQPVDSMEKLYMTVEVYG